MSELLYLTENILQKLPVSPAEIVASIESVVSRIRTGSVVVAPKTATRTNDGRYVMATLAASDDAGLVAVKSVMFNARNKQQHLPSINGAILLLDSETGVLKAVLDANWITATRTAGLSAVAAKRLANPDSGTIALVGAGVQAESHLRTFASLFPLRHAKIAGRGKSGIDHMHSVASELGLTSETCQPRACIEHADIVVSSVTLDFNLQPFLSAGWLQPGAFAAITDQAMPWQRNGQAAFDTLYIDDIALEKSLDKPMVDSSLISGELTDLVHEHSLFDKQKRSAFIFRGIAAGDLAVSALAYHRFIEQHPD